MVVYSPSQTTTWCRCPLKRQLAKAWAPRGLGKPALSRILGQAVGAGVASYYREGRWTQIGGQADKARKVAKEALQSLLAAGHVVVEAEESFALKLPEITARGVERYMAADPIPSHWELVAVEETLENHGQCRPDFVWRSPQGLIVPDLKTKRTLDSRYEHSTLEDYRTSWQLSHYAWAAEEHYKEKVAEVGTILVVLEPRFRVRMDLYPPDGELQQMWFESANRAWGQMNLEDTGQAEPWMAAEHRDRFGLCEFWKACFECRLDGSLMEREYIRRERIPQDPHGL